MSGEGGVLNPIPVEETIIDPLYEPLKLKRYELCPHLQRLRDISHLRYGLSPYLLFDVEGMREVVETIGLFNKENYDDFYEYYKEFIEKFKKYLYLFERYINWAVNRDRKPIKEDGNIRWDSKKPFLLCEEEKYKNENKKSLDNRNEIYWELRKRKEEIIRIYQEVKNKYRKILEQFLYTSDEFNVENYKKIAHLFRLDYPVRVKCPLCGKSMFMCEEGKIYSMKEALLRTFEFRRARWLYQSGMLHLFHKASTHTRLSHQIGCLIVAVNALREIDVYPAGDFKMTLGEYLLMRGELHEFLMANLLHDLGHPPLSHVLEVNPFIKLNHEEITRNLILGKPTEEGKMDWYVAERLLLKMKAIKDFEYRFFENRYDPIYEIDVEKEVGEELDEDKLGGYFLEYLDKKNEILESEIITVTEVLDNFGVDKERIVEILRGIDIDNCEGCFRKIVIRKLQYTQLLEVIDEKIICPLCFREIDKLKIEIDNHDKKDVYDIQFQNKFYDKKDIYDIQFLNKLVDSEIDFDRIDHVKRDSDICGLSLTSFRLLELLGSISIVLPGSNAHENVHKAEKNRPYIFVSEDGLKYVMDLLNTRRLIFNEVLYSDENNWINGVVNQITAQVVRYLPHLTIMLPFITDPVLAHFYTNELFLGTQIEKLNKLFYGEISYSAYGKPMGYKLKDNEFVIKEDIKEIYRKIEKLNEKYERMEFPAIVLYTNIEPAKCPKCGSKELYRENNKIRCMKCGDIGENEIKESNKKKRDDIKKWNNMLVFGKKFRVGNEQKYLKFRKLEEKGIYKEISRERFPKKPSESDFKNILYIWVSDLIGDKKKELIDEIMEKVSIIKNCVDLDRWSDYE